MTVCKHELKQGRLSLVIWTAAISLMIGLCILIYPEMGSQMEDFSAIFADMGSFTAAFGMDKINFGEFIGFFGVECGNVLGLGGAFFAALIGISALAKEEKEHTAEFLLTHPISRTRVLAEKLLAVVLQILILNAVVAAVCAGCIRWIGEDVEWKPLALVLTANLLMQLEICAVTFGISAFVRHSGLGIGLGLAAVFYFLNIVANLTEKARFLKYFTPFGYTDSADIISECTLNGSLLAVGIALGAAGILAAFRKYTKKDIA